PRDFVLDLSFLGDGDYDAVIFSDGINADRHAQDYSRAEREISEDSAVKISMAPGGGWVARLTKK
ncbi:MAG: glycoside hydrolase family 97 C-terminal domain-containing protein, partial [bacterium]